MFNPFKRKPASSGPEEPSFSADQVVPRIKHLNFLEAVKPMLAQIEKVGGDPKAQAPVTRPLIGDLIVSYSFDTPQLFRSVSYQAMQKLRLDIAGIDRLAIANLEQAIPNGVLLHDLTVYHAVETGGNLEACTLLLSNFWNKVAAQFNGEPIVVVPSRSAVFCMDSRCEIKVNDKTLDTETILNLMCSSAASLKAEEQVHGLSNLVFAWKNNDWEVRGSLDNHSSVLSN